MKRKHKVTDDERRAYKHGARDSLHRVEVVADRLGISPSSLEAARRNGGKNAIPYVQIAQRRIAYLKGIVEDWLGGQPLKRSTSDPGVPLGTVELHPLDNWLRVGDQGSRGSRDGESE